jgi:hypothetical protein
MDYERLIAETREQAEEIREAGLWDCKASHIADDFQHLANVIETLRKELASK